MPFGNGARCSTLSIFLSDEELSSVKYFKSTLCKLTGQLTVMLSAKPDIKSVIYNQAWKTIQFQMSRKVLMTFLSVQFLVS